MQTPNPVLNVGADVAKDEIVVACSDGSFPVRKLANQRAALRSFLKTLPPGSRIGMESTGIYHQLLADLACRQGLVVYVLNPKDARHYARGVGLRSKTDRVDAELIARMIEREHANLHVWVPPTPEQREIDQLIKRRSRLVSMREGLGMSLKGMTEFNADLRATRKRFNQLIAHIDQRIQTLIEADPDRKEHVTQLRTINGVGALVGAALVSTLERMPLKSADAFVAFTGLDPRAQDSGQHRGRRRISKRGPAELRRLLYLAAMAARKTTTWKPLYEHYREKGLSGTESVVILARRIARMAWSMYTYKTEFDPARLTKCLT
jgi:transposase